MMRMLRERFVSNKNDLKKPIKYAMFKKSGGFSIF